MKHLYEYLEFNDLSDSAKKNAIEKIRKEKYEGGYGADDIPYWVVDDDSLFEPSEKEMTDLFGNDYYHANGDRFMIANTRKNISFVSKSDPNYYLSCSDALDITNDNLFYRWLGIPIKYAKDLYYSFNEGRSSNTTIILELDGYETDIFGDEGAPESFWIMLDNAKSKFDKHIDSVLTRITNDIESQFEDDGIIETIESNEITFDEDGNPSY